MRRPIRPLLVLAALLVTTSAVAEDIAVIVNPQRTARLGRDEVAQIYLKKRRFWQDGSGILPVNREAGAANRSRFERAIFGAGVRRLPVYWNREYFRGVLPPATLASDEAVRRFVASEPRAIGYVRASTVDDSVRVVLTVPADTP